MRHALAIAAMLLALTMPATAQTAAPPTLDSLAEGARTGGFRVVSLYLNATAKPMGGRFIHEKSGFVLDYLQIESVPQGYTWVNTFPTSDQGEPHTQEHLLLGKGTTGRAFAGLDTMWLASSNAFTQQWRTSYHFNTAAGADVFFAIFGAELNALLHPNYTDEEIRREVRHFGVTANADGTLRLEEKGSVYNEMVSSTGNPYRQQFRAASHLIYGEGHPLAFNSGGEPSGIRTMKPEHIRDFHRSTHYLANIGTIVSFPKSVPLAEILRRTSEILERVEPEGKTREAHTPANSLPPPKAATAGSIRYPEYPHRNEQQPSPLGFWWPADRDFDANELLLADLFFSTFAGDATTNLYKLFIDSRSRKLDIGARQVFHNVDTDQGNPIYIDFTDVSPAQFTDEKVSVIRDIVTGELARVAAFPDGSAELREFNERVSGRVIALERDLARFVNSPPGFGFRNGTSAWMDQLLLLEKTPTFKKSLTLGPQIAFVRKQLASDKNVWRDYLAKWKVTGVVPYAVAARPSPALIAREESERVARAAAEAERLAKAYGVPEQEALKRYQTEYEAESKRIEDEAKKIKPPAFVESPPMTIDDQLEFKVQKLAGVPIVVSRFDNMTSSMTGLALRLDSVPREQLRYLSLLPALLTRVGVIEKGKPVSFEEMSERLRKEILSLDAAFTTNPRTERVELQLRGAGIGVAESQRALDWMQLVLTSPDWRPENLPRIRDLVDQSLSTLRNTMQGSEESWVQNPANAWRMQASPLFLSTDSVLTRVHNALRLRWLLRETPAGVDGQALAAFLTQLADAAKNASRAELKTFLASGTPTPAPLQAHADALARLAPPAQAIAKEAMRDLDLTLIEIPDSSLAADWSYLTLAIRDDLATPPATALAQLDALRRGILRRGHARMFFVGSDSSRTSLSPKLTALLNTLGEGSAKKIDHGSTALVKSRLQQRDATATDVVHVGLLAPNMKGGVIITFVPAVQYADTDDREKQLDFLASRLHASYGAHGVFLKTIGAGLAYSNGLRASIAAGRMGYYAERTPELPETVRFVINELKSAPRDPSLGDYAIAQAFDDRRSAATYEARAEGIAADLADGQPPEQVRKFRQSILELRKDPTLGDKLFDRKDRVYATFLPGYERKRSGGADTIFFTIGPDKQLDAWDRYVREAEGAESRVYKLYPRDFWMA